MTNKPIISMEKVFKKYENNALALNDINVEIHKGEFVFIVGFVTKTLKVADGACDNVIINLLFFNLHPEVINQNFH